VRILACTLLAVLLVAGCGGGDDGDDAASGQDVNQLLEETFAETGKLESAKVDLSGELEGVGTVALSGAVETQGSEFPKLDLEGSYEFADQSVSAGITTTGDEGFVSYQGTDYQLSDEVFRELQDAYAQAQSSQKQGMSLATLGLDPRKWLTDPRVDGESKVGDTETIKITGGVDVAKLLDDFGAAAERAGSLGFGGVEPLTEAEKRQAARAFRDMRVEIHTGADDHILRRLAVTATVAAAGSQLPGAFELTLLDVNEDQEIEAPADARPFTELLGKLDGLVPGAAGGGGTSAENLEQYSECVEDAGRDAAALRKCADLLTP
jgi:hypothetical protein